MKGEKDFLDRAVTVVSMVIFFLAVCLFLNQIGKH